MEQTRVMWGNREELCISAWERGFDAPQKQRGTLALSSQAPQGACFLISVDGNICLK